MKYRPEIDGLRAVAIIPVILFHAGINGFSGGYIGVDIFFVISGFLITSIILEQQVRGSFSLLNFYEKRARRILPAFFTVVLFCIPFAIWLMSPNDLITFAQSIIASLIFVSNVFFWTQSGYFSGDTQTYPLLHTWTLSVEEQFYLFFPLLLILAQPICKRYGYKWLVTVLIVIAVVSLGVAEFASRKFPTANFYLTPGRVWELMTGCICAYFVTRHEDIFLKKRLKIHSFLSACGLVLIIASIIWFEPTTPYPSLYTVLPVIGTALILTFCTKDCLAGRILSYRLFVAIGLISYSLYLWHQPLYAFMHLAGIYSQLAAFLSLPILIALSIISWKFIEQPFRKKTAMPQIYSFKTLSFALVVVCCISAVIISQKGFITRYPEYDRKLLLINPKTSGDYTEALFNAHKDKEFLDNDTPKHLIIGDSFAQDLLNILHEAKVDQGKQISTFRIRTRCGNLDLSPALYEENIPTEHLRTCHVSHNYADENLQQRIREADVIWLAASWSDWEAKLLSESIKSISSKTNAKIIVLGTKSFANETIKNLTKIPVELRANYKTALNPDVILVNDILRKNAHGATFIDVIKYVCDANKECPVFTTNGNLISYDGDHLTPEGAQFLSEKLKPYL